MAKNKSPRFKVWVEIERLTKDGDEDRSYTPPLPDCVGTADNEAMAMAIQYNIALQFCEDADRSDCRPRVGAVADALKKLQSKKKCPACKRPVATCACIPVGDEQELAS